MRGGDDTHTAVSEHEGPGPLKVLLAHSRYSSGPASGENRVVDDEAQLLRQAGHDVVVHAPGAGGKIKAAGRSVWSRRALADISAIVEGWRPDLIHVHNLFPELSPAVLRRDEAPVVMTLHNYRLLCLPATFRRDGRICEDCLGRLPWPGVVHRCYRGSLPGSAALGASHALHRGIGSFDRVALFVAVSEFVRLKHLEGGLPAERIHVKPNFAWPQERRRGPGDFFLYVGRYSEEKGLEELVSAWPRRFPPLVLVGDGPIRSRITAAAPPNVEVRGPLEPAEIPALLRQARAFILRSISYEGCPRGIIEAYAAGVPAIASGLGGVAEVVENGRSGILVDAEDRGAWHSAVDELLDDAVSIEMGTRAHRLWQERFSPEVALARQLALYDLARSA